MANGDPLSLEIRIRTIAEGQGVTLTDAQIAALTQKLERSTQAGKDLEAALAEATKEIAALGAAGKEIQPAADGLSAASAASKELEQSAATAAAGVKEIGTAGKDIAPAADALKEAGSATKALEQSATTAAEEVKAVATAAKEIAPGETKTLAADLDAAAQSSAALGTAAGQAAQEVEKVTAAAEDARPAAQSIDQMAEAFAKANTQGERFGNTIGTLSNDQLLALEERIRSEISATEALGQSTDELKEKLAETYDLRTSKLEDTLTGVADATKQVGAAGRAAGTDLKGLGQDFRQGADAGRVLGQVLTGNFTNIGQLGGAVKGLGAVIKANLIGVLVTLGVVAGQVIIPLIAGFNKAKKSAEEVAESLSKAEAAGKAFGAAKLDGINKGLTTARTEAEALRSVLIQNLAIQGKREEAEAAAEIARIEADPNLTPDQKTTRREQVDDQLVTGQRKREDIERNVGLDASAEQVRLAADRLKQEEELNRLKLDELVEAQKAIAERAELEAQLKAARRQFTLEGIAAGESPSPQAQDRLAQLADEIQATSAQLKNTPSFDELGQRSETASGELEQFSLAVRAAAEALKAEQVRDKVVQDAARRQSIDIEATRAAEDDKRNVERADAQLKQIDGKIGDAQAAQQSARETGNRGAEGIAASLITNLEKLKADLIAQVSSREEIDRAIERAIANAAAGNGLNKQGSITGPDGITRNVAPLPKANTGSSIAKVSTPPVGSSLASAPTPPPAAPTVPIVVTAPPTAAAEPAQILVNPPAPQITVEAAPAPEVTVEPTPVVVTPAPAAPTVSQQPIPTAPPAPTAPAAVPNPFLPLPAATPAAAVPNPFLPLTAAPGTPPPAPGGPDVQQQNNEALKEVADTVANFEKPGALDNRELNSNLVSYNRVIVQKLQESAANQAATAKQVAELTRAVAAVQVAQRNAAESVT